MSAIGLSYRGGSLEASVTLPASKSISNRALILHAIGAHTIDLHNLSAARDTVLMQEALQQHSGEIGLENAGTCMRFLAAYFACREGADVKLLCDARMEQRPIGILVDALRSLGAEIDLYMHNEGFPPVHVRGNRLHGGKVRIDASVSSQFTSALMMIGAQCSNGLQIMLEGQVSSEPYIHMTASIMREFGYGVQLSGNGIMVKSPAGIPKIQRFEVEPDWSSASYWYEMAALSNEAEIVLAGLTQHSIQGDRVIADHMKLFGVETTFTEAGAVLTKKTHAHSHTLTSIDLSGAPDLAPALAVTAAATYTPLNLTGLKNLRTKESNRLLALETELNRAGYHVSAEEDALCIHPQTVRTPPAAEHLFNTYGDHRIAMAFAPLALFNPIRIEAPQVVEKSYPGFWADLESAGIVLSPF